VHVIHLSVRKLPVAQGKATLSGTLPWQL
jgi:hypothetical protein